MGVDEGPEDLPGAPSRSDAQPEGQALADDADLARGSDTKSAALTAKMAGKVAASGAGQPQSDDPREPLLQRLDSTEADSDALGPQEAGSKPEPRSVFDVGGPPVDQLSVIRRVNWHILPIFFCLAMLCSIDRANLSFAALQLNYDLHFTSDVYGYGSGIFFVGYALFAIPSTFVCARLGAPVFLGSALIAWGVVASLFAAMRRSWQFYVLRFVLGLAESGAYPGMWYHLALFYDEREMGLAYTLVSTASSLSGVAGALLAFGLLHLDGFLGLHGWQWLFVLEGFPAVILGVILILHLAKSPAEARFLSPEERQWLCNRKGSVEAHKAAPDEAGGIAEPSAHVPTRRSLALMLREWRIWYLAAIWAIISVGMDTLNFWLPLLIKTILYGEGEDGDDEDVSVRAEIQKQSLHTALLSSIPFSSAAVGMVVIAMLSKRARERHWHIAAPLLVGTAAMAATPLAQRGATGLAVATLTVGAVGIWGPHGPLLSWPAALLEGDAAAAGFALIKTVGAFAASAGNAVMGELHEETGSFALPILLLAGLLAVGAVLALNFREPGHERSRTDIRSLVGRLHDRLAMKRSRSDPAVFYAPRRAPSEGPLSTIREGVARPDRGGGFEMPHIQPRLDAADQFAQLRLAI